MIENLQSKLDHLKRKQAKGAKLGGRKMLKDFLQSI